MIWMAKREKKLQASWPTKQKKKKKKIYIFFASDKEKENQKFLNLK